MKTGRFSDAFREFETALKLNPDNVNVRNNLESLKKFSGELKR
jgi:Tfp pilus assembly protein PilF